MAVKECGECGGQVSTKAAACPHCGYACKRWYSVFLRRWWLLPVTVVLCGFGFVRAADEYALSNVSLKEMEVGGYIPLFSLKNVVVQNDNWFAVKDAEITCSHKDKHGRNTSKNDIVTNYVILAGDAVKFAELNFGADINIDIMEGDFDILPDHWFNAKQVSCAITAVNVASLSE